MLPSVWQTIRVASDVAHVPVLAREVVELLAPEPGMTVVDGTFGAGGHAHLLAERMEGRGAYVAIDRDPGVREGFVAFKEHHPDMSARLLRGNFSVGLRNLAATGTRADAILLDLGISSMQVDQAERGFSYALDAPLDMRMDPTEPRTAADLLAELPEAELSAIFHRYGEERFSRPIARAIVRQRERTPFLRSAELVETIREAIPVRARFGAGHPAKRVFQALRIAVNDELRSVEEGLQHAFALLRPGGRIAVISFHSLEDRIVKHAFRDAARGCICPPDLPVCGCGVEPILRVITPRVVRPAAAEVETNPRAASARLRVAERTDAPLPGEAGA